MDELVIPIARQRMWVAVITIGLFLLIPASLLVIAVLQIVTAEHPSVVMVVGLTFIGLPLSAVLGCLLFGAVSNLRSPGLRLNADGFELNGRSLAWTDVDDFRAGVDGESGQVTHITVICTPDAGRRIPAFNTARNLLGLRAVPTRLQLNAFDAGNVPLIDILRAWHHGDRQPGRQLDVPATGLSPKLLRNNVFKLKRGPTVLASLGLGSMFVFVVAVGSGVLATRDYSDPTMIYLGIVTGALLLGMAVAFGYFTYRSLRKLRSPGLLLDDKGFQFDGHVWRWDDIEDFQTVEYGRADEGTTTRIRVIYRPDHTNHTGPADTALDPARFDTGTAHLEQILRQRLHRHTTSAG